MGKSVVEGTPEPARSLGLSEGAARGRLSGVISVLGARNQVVAARSAREKGRLQEVGDGSAQQGRQAATCVLFAGDP